LTPECNPTYPPSGDLREPCGCCGRNPARVCMVCEGALSDRIAELEAALATAVEQRQAAERVANGLLGACNNLLAYADHTRRGLLVSMDYEGNVLGAVREAVKTAAASGEASEGAGNG
jgi:hypothetical protein